MKKFLLNTCILLLICLALHVPAFAKEKIRIGTEGAYPPFNSVNAQGELVGFDIDIAKALMQEMNADYDFVIQAWDGLIPALLAKKIDCIIASVSMNEQRRKIVDFTVKYYQTPAIFVVPRATDVEFTAKGLEGKVIGVQGASTHEAFVRDNFPAAEAKPYQAVDDACADMVYGRVDMVLGDLVGFKTFLDSAEGRKFTLAGPEYTDPNYFGDGIGIAVRKGDIELLGALNQAIKAIQANGIYKQINAKYFAYDISGNGAGK